MRRWALLTGEYPPRSGGVADYTRLLARGLIAAGEAVEVWSPGAGGGDPEVRVRLLPGLGARGVLALQRGLEPGTILLLQYAPHAFGMRGLNLPFCAWASRWRAGPLWVMFHEVHFPRTPGATMRRRVLARVQMRMAGLVARAATRSFVSTESWRPVLAALAPGSARPDWLPVPSNLPERVAPEAVARVRSHLPIGGQLIGHFGTHGPWYAERLHEVLRPLLLNAARRAVLLGRGGAGTREAVLRSSPELADRISALEGDPGEVAAHLAACDLVIQPYVDGPSTRRGTLMAALALGRAVISNEGPLTEPSFRREPLLCLAASPGEIVDEAEALLRDPVARLAQGERAAVAYRERFSLARTVERLRACAEGSPCGSP